MFVLVRCVILTTVLLAQSVSSSLYIRIRHDVPPLPKVWQIVWSNVISDTYVQDLKAQGVDGLFKCVSFFEDHPAGEWRWVEDVEGQYNWSDMRRCLDIALKQNVWVIPELVINIPPDWFIQRYPHSTLLDSRGEFKPSNIGETPYLLSPWFVASGEADAYLFPLVKSFLDLVAGYPNVAGIMVGNFLLNNLPWCLGDEVACDGSTVFTYWTVWDSYALSEYESVFGQGQQPPSTWADYEAMVPFSQFAFRQWLVSAISTNLQDRYLPWIAEFEGWKVVNAPIWNGDTVRASVFTTNTPEMTGLKQSAINGY